MASKHKETPKKSKETAATTDASGTSAADVGTTEPPAPSSSGTAPAADTSGAESSAKPKVCSSSTSDPLLFLFRLLSFFPSLFDTYYEPPQTT